MEKSGIMMCNIIIKTEELTHIMQKGSNSLGETRQSRLFRCRPYNMFRSRFHDSSHRPPRISKISGIFPSCPVRNARNNEPNEINEPKNSVSGAWFSMVPSFLSAT